MQSVKNTTTIYCSFYVLLGKICGFQHKIGMSYYSHIIYEKAIKLMGDSDLKMLTVIYTYPKKKEIDKREVLKDITKLEKTL